MLPRLVTPLPFVWPYLLAYWGVCLWVFWPEMQIVRRATKAASQAGSQDAGSVRLIMIGGGLTAFIAYPIAWVAAFRFPQSLDVVSYFIGVATVVASSLLRRHCWKHLGASFTGDVRASADQPIVTTGAYSILRHPSYSAAILMNIGSGLALGSWASILLLTIAGFVIYGYRISVEERALTTALGEPYREFMRSRRRLIPFIY